MSDVHAWLAGQADRVIETSCAWVFLQGERALKVKQPVDYGFLDYSTAEKRRWALERELAFNRVTAPDIYRAVRRITRDGGGLAFDARARRSTTRWRCARSTPPPCCRSSPSGSMARWRRRLAGPSRASRPRRRCVPRAAG
ncbi:MAG: hypothetical protein WDM85_18990 [Caulobacteraceae bacterium]